MFLQIMVGSKKPTIYKILKSEITIGVLPICDIVLTETSVSKKHLKFSISEGACFVMDNGSTNGSYLESERLIPGKKVEFKFDQELRLGANTFLTLVSSPEKNQIIEIKDKDASTVSVKSTHEKTTVLSIEDFKAADAMARQKKQEALAEKRKALLAKKKKDKKLMIKVGIFTLILLGVGYYLNKNYKMSDRKKDTNITKAAKALSKSEDKLKNIE